MANKIRLGFVGANVRSHWASQSHFPALKASRDVEMTAVCTTRAETAEAAKQAFNAVRSILQEFGVGPGSRTKVTALPDDEDDDAAARYFNEKRRVKRFLA